MSVTSLHCRITSLYIVKNFAFGSEVVKYVEDDGKGLINSCEHVKGKLQNSPEVTPEFPATQVYLKCCCSAEPSAEELVSLEGLFLALLLTTKSLRRGLMFNLNKSSTYWVALFNSLLGTKVALINLTFSKCLIWLPRTSLNLSLPLSLVLPLSSSGTWASIRPELTLKTISLLCTSGFDWWWFRKSETGSTELMEDITHDDDVTVDVTRGAQWKEVSWCRFIKSSSISRLDKFNLVEYFL